MSNQRFFYQNKSQRDRRDDYAKSVLRAFFLSIVTSNTSIRINKMAIAQGFIESIKAP